MSPLQSLISPTAEGPLRSASITHPHPPQQGRFRHAPLVAHNALFALTSPSFSNHWRISLLTSSGFCVSAQCVAATSLRVKLGISASMLLDISGLRTES